MLKLVSLKQFLEGKNTTTYRRFSQMSDSERSRHIALRHDIDENIGKSARMAEWEYEHGWIGTYFFLHGIPYWDTEEMWTVAAYIEALRMEIGFHYNALMMCDGNFARAAEMMEHDLAHFRSFGFDVVGCAAHGSIKRHALGFGNEALWTRNTLEEFGLEYEAYQVQRSFGLSATDNGGQLPDFSEVKNGGTITLHPQHWEV